jgi:hypothetical protein
MCSELDVFMTGQRNKFKGVTFLYILLNDISVVTSVLTVLHNKLLRHFFSYHKQFGDHKPHSISDCLLELK